MAITGSEHHMAITDYWRALVAYMPVGPIWRILSATDGEYPDGVPKPLHWLSRLLCGIAESLNRLAQDISTTARDACPATASLAGIRIWERLLFDATQDYLLIGTDRRRSHLLATLRLNGNNSLSFWRSLAVTYGLQVDLMPGPWRLYYIVTCSAFFRLRAGDRAGKRLFYAATDTARSFAYLAWLYRVAGMGIWWSDA